MSAEEILGKIEAFEKSFDTYQQSIQKNIDGVINKLSVIWKQMQLEQKEIEKLDIEIDGLKSELTTFKTEYEGLDKEQKELKKNEEEINTKITEANNQYEKKMSDLNEPKLELQNISSKLESVNEKINTKEKEKSDLEEQKIKNENMENDLKIEYGTKQEELEKKSNSSKSSNFFTAFVMENSDEDINEVSILATVMKEGSCKLDDLKKQLDIPPILAVRTIKKLALKEIIILDENTNIITMPE